MIKIYLCKSHRVSTLGPGGGNSGNESGTGYNQENDNNHDADSHSYSESSNIVNEETSAISLTTESTTEIILEITVTISGKKYFYENRSYDIEGLMNELSAITSKYTILIQDDNASQKAYQELVDALDSHKIKYSGPFYE